MNKLNELLELNVNGMTEKKSGLTYLSWANAWKEFIKVYPNATYTIKKNPNGVPVFGDSTGYIVFTTVTVEDLTHEMWLPVMNGANKAMKLEAYTYKTKYGEKEVEPMSMFDVNKTVMRCLTKNLAMFGLGLYIYAGEDLPVAPEEYNQPKDVSIKQQINNALNLPNVKKEDRDNYIDQLKSGKLPVNQDTLDKICIELGV